MPAGAQRRRYGGAKALLLATRYLRRRCLADRRVSAVVVYDYNLSSQTCTLNGTVCLGAFALVAASQGKMGDR